MARAKIPHDEKTVNAGISLPKPLIELISKAAFRDGKSKSALAHEIIRAHFRRLERNAKRRKTATKQTSEDTQKRPRFFVGVKGGAK
jgi:hypothetical protein